MPVTDIPVEPDPRIRDQDYVAITDDLLFDVAGALSTDSPDSLVVALDPSVAHWLLGHAEKYGVIFDQDRTPRLHGVEIIAASYSDEEYYEILTASDPDVVACRVSQAHIQGAVSVYAEILECREELSSGEMPRRQLLTNI